MAAASVLEEFVREALNRGAKPEAISAELTAAGWPPREVQAALAQWAVASFGLAVPKPKAYVSAREAFLYIVMFNLLGLVAYNLGSLLFALIDAAIEDALDTTVPYMLHGQIRGALAALAVATPLLGGFGWYIARERHANPAMQQSRVRKWLTYVTLIAAALTFVGDLIALVYNFLSGDLSERLLLKLIVVGAIAAGIFVFFVRDVEADKPRGWFDVAPLLAGVGVAAVLIAAIAGYRSIEDPIAVRELRLDDARLETMRRVAAAAQCAYSFTGRIPQSYAEIRSAFEDERTAAYGECVAVGYAASDETRVSYEADDAAHVRLCSTFQRESRAGTGEPTVATYPPRVFPELDQKRTAAGRHCYRVRMVKLKLQETTPAQPPPVPPAEAPPASEPVKPRPPQ
jgi:hypothetical protein